MIEGVFLDFRRLHRGDLILVERVAQPLTLVGFDPIAMHLENVVRFVRPRTLPIQSGPGFLQLVED